MQFLGVAAFPLVVADNGLFVHPGQSGRGTHATPFLGVLEHRHDLLFVQARVKQGRAFALGKARLASTAIQQAPLLGFSVVSAHGQVSQTTLTVVRTVLILATETGKILHAHPPER